jgi:hypothetical protein
MKSQSTMVDCPSEHDEPGCRTLESTSSTLSVASPGWWALKTPLIPAKVRSIATLALLGEV